MTMKAYGLEAFTDVFPSPEIQRRDPNTNDKKYEIGQIWINRSTNDAFVLTNIDASGANWESVTTEGSLTGLTLVTSDTFATTNVTKNVTWTNNVFTAGGTDANVSIFLNAKAQGTVDHSRSLVGADVFINSVNGDTTDTASGAGFTAQVGGDGAGDAKSIYRITGGKAYSLGLDNSTTDNDFVISNSAALGTNNILSVDGSTLDATFSAAVTVDGGDLSVTNGDLNLDSAGNKLNIAAGVNASVGTTVAMVTGAVTVNTTAVTASSLIFVQPATLGTVAAPQAGYVSAIVPGTSFTITSADGTDTSSWNYWIIN